MAQTRKQIRGRMRMLEYILVEYTKQIELKQNLIENQLPDDTLELLNKIQEEKQNINIAFEKEKANQYRAQKLMQLRLKEVQLQIDEAHELMTAQLQPKLQELRNSFNALSRPSVLENESENSANRKDSIVSETKQNTDNTKREEKFKSTARKVTFSEDTVELKSNAVKRGGKKFQLKSVSISDFMKK